MESAHPRSRGEHVSPPFSDPLAFGSSPLARGTSRLRCAYRYSVRLIPARAGNIPARRGGHAPSPAHPRSRGEHSTGPANRFSQLGSSPLARGTYPHGGARGVQLRLIPARAGNILADMGFYPLHQQNRITLEPEPASRIHDKQQLLTTTSTTIPTRLAPPRFRHNLTSHRTIN